MKVTNKDIIEFIEKQNDWIDGETIARHFDISLKTVFNYIKRINDYRANLILSSNKGYAINPDVDYDKDSLFFNDSLNARINYVIRMLLVGDKEADIYTIADSLYVSDSYIESLLKYVRKNLSKYSLSLQRKRNKIKIIGSEINKRRLISSLVTREKANNMMEKTAKYFSNENVDVSLLQSIMVELFQKYSVYVNDYGFNTILIYMAVSINRIKSNETISSFAGEDILPSIDYNAFLTEVKTRLEKEFDMILPKHEYYYLSLVIKNNCTAYDLGNVNMDNIRSYIDQSIIDHTLTAIYKLEKQYHLDQFDDSFKIKIILHVQMLIERINQQYVQNNPLAARIKSSYPIIYDMATYLVKEIFNRNHDFISDEEISFLAIHIGSYLDQSIAANNRLKVCFVYADYHHYYEHILEEIYEHFKETINIVSRISIKYNDTIPTDIDCIITNFPLIKTYGQPVFVLDDLMIKTSKYINDLTLFIQKLQLEKKKNSFKSSLEKFIAKDFFFYNLPIDGYDNIINYLCQQANKKGYTRKDFYNEVIEREMISSTAYDSSVAIPHSLYQNCYKSFFCIVANDKSVSWDDKSVNLIILIGVQPDDNRDFQIVLNALIPYLTSSINVQKLLTCRTYNELIDTLVDNIFDH